MQNITLSRANVFVTAKPHPCSKALRFIAAAVVGGADANQMDFQSLNHAFQQIYQRSPHQNRILGSLVVYQMEDPKIVQT